MSLVVRTWNLYHGRTHPPGRGLYLQQMVELVTGDGPDLVALQEVPLWALGRLEGWSGMAARSVVAVPSPLPGRLARAVTSANPVRLRSLVSGQANVLLSGSQLQVGAGRTLLLNPGIGRWEWLTRRGRQQRYCQRQEFTTADGRLIVVAHLHASHDPQESPAEIDRAAALVADSERTVFCGDFNAREHPVEEYSAPIPGVDQILVRGLSLVSGPAAWPKERRTIHGAVLSDHAPVEAVVAA